MKKVIYGLILLFFFSCGSKDSSTSDSVKKVKKYSIEEFYKNNRIGGGQFSDDEQRLLVSSDESGIFNVYEIDITSGEKKAITNSTGDSHFSIDYVPGTKDILYSADKGGNEINHIYLLKEDGTTVDLTDGEKEKASFAGWSKDRQFMYFSSNKRDDKYFDRYKMKIGEWNPELIYKNEDGTDIRGMTNDENIFALAKTITTSENQLWLNNRKTTTKTEISDPENPGSYNASGFSDDGKYFYYTTDVGKEFTYLVEYEIATGNRKTVYQTDWDVMYSYLSENEKYRVVAVNADGKNTLEIVNHKTNEKVPFPEIKDGDVTAVSISDSEKQMRLSVGTSRAPSNIYVYNFESGDLKKMTETLNPAMNADDLVSAEVVRYKSFDGTEIPAIYYKPHGATADNKVPALVWVHGGPGGQSRTGYFSLIQYLTNHGYAILAVNNRGSSGYGKTFYKMDDRNHGDKDLKDCIWGKKWLASQNYINADEIGIIGGSYGGYMTMAAMAFEPDEFKVGVDIFGVTNWLRTLKSIPPFWESFRKALYTELGDPFTADSVRLYNISPLFHADKIKNPVMVLQGANDPRVLQAESDEIVEGR